jgi:TonB family protein
MAYWKALTNLKLTQFVYFVNHLNRRQLAFLSTLFSMGFLLLILGNLHLYPNYFKAEKDIEILMALESAPLPKEDNKAVLEAKEIQENSADFKSNNAYNTAKKATYSSMKPNTSSGIIAANGSEDVGIGNTFNEKLMALEEENQKVLDSLKAQKSNYTNLSSRTRVYYHLFERDKTALPIPVYTCKQGGKVVVNIKVTPDGVVVGTEINTVKSTTTNGCLLENALKYASKAQFNTREGKMQWGTITYYFQAKN